MTVKSAASWSGTFVCKDATGALAVASVGPAGTLYLNGTANAASVTISGGNPYKWTLTLPALSAGDRCDMYITATVGGIATAAIVASDDADTKLVSGLNDIAATAVVTNGAITTLTGAVVNVGTVTTVTGLTVANLDGKVTDAIAAPAAALVAVNLDHLVGTATGIPPLPAGTYLDGPIKSDLRSILGTALTETAGQIAAAFKKFFNVASPTGTVNSIPDALPSAANGLPLKSDLPAAAPTVNAIADQVLDESLAAHLTAGSTGAALNTISTGRITVVSPMSQDGLAVKLVRGDDYLNADGRALVWTDSGSQWPNLTGATVKFKWVTFSKSCTVIGAGGAHQQVSLDLTSAETDVMQNGYFDIEATLSNTHVVTIVVAGSLIIRDDV